MFIDQTSPLQPENSALGSSEPEKKSKKIWIISGGIVLFLALAGGAWFWWQRDTKVATPPPSEEEIANLPSNSISSSNEDEPGDSEFKAEKLAFGTYYKSFNEPLTINIKPVNLPLNVKSEVANFYEVGRKINLDAAVNNLNKNGFAIIQNPFTRSGDNFFSIYGELESREIPLLLTSDFTWYYYENSLQRIYQEIENSYFYDNLWKINKELFKVADGRYLERQRKLGSASDSLLEAQRLEAGYFATALALLSPQSGQIMTEKDIAGSGKFSQLEATKYQFSIPDYLTDDVTKELALIKAAAKTEKSPLLLYDRDYKEFAIPSNYTKNQKLKNVFLTERWETTFFPLYYQAENCSTCALDRDDWTINQIAAYLISEHISSNQSLKNEWAKVYKVISYFSGLRSGITYLHYQTTRQALFGDKTVEEIFADQAQENLEKLSSELAKIDFPALEGGYSASNPQERPLIGMRLLQPAFWPDQYFYDRLTFSAVGDHNRPLDTQGKARNFFTGCVDSKGKEVYRCRGFGFDIIGSVTTETPTNNFYRENLDYQKYTSERTKLQTELENFTKGEWYVNQFWTVLSIAKAFLNTHVGNLPYMNLPAWREREITTSLASLAALRLMPDEWEINRSISDNNLETGSAAEKFNYVEVSNSLQDELVANASMILGALSNLGVVAENDVQFRELIDRLKMIRDINRKELAGEALTSNQQQFISDLVRQYTVSRSGQREVKNNFYDTSAQRTRIVTQTIGPLRLLVLVYEQGGQKFLAVGPVFNYTEN